MAESLAIRRRWRRYGVVILACLLAVMVIDLVTNDLNTTRYYWDFALYYDMAEHGLVGNHNLWAPFVYRFATPLLAGAIMRVLSLSVVMSFKVIAYVGAVAQLFAVFVLAEYFGARIRQALIAAAVVALSLYNVKFLIFDVSRPDHLAYPLMVAAILALFERRYALVVAVSCVGLLVREFLIIPPMLLLGVLLRDYLNTRSRESVKWMAITLVAVGLFVIVPRVAIPIKGSGQYVDPVNDASTLSNLIKAPLSERRDLNIIFNLLSYTLPLLVLVTIGRIRRVWTMLHGYRVILGAYTALVLLFTLYGGTDLWRFVTYLFIPLVIVLALLLRQAIDPAEIGYMLVVVAIYNKMWQSIPNYYVPYLDFYGGYDNRVNVITLWRLYELAAFIAGAIVLRGLLALARRGWRLTPRVPVSAPRPEDGQGAAS